MYLKKTQTEQKGGFTCFNFPQPQIQGEFQEKNNLWTILVFRRWKNPVST